MDVLAAAAGEEKEGDSSAEEGDNQNGVGHSVFPKSFLERTSSDDEDEGDDEGDNEEEEDRKTRLEEAEEFKAGMLSQAGELLEKTRRETVEREESEELNSLLAVKAEEEAQMQREEEEDRKTREAVRKVAIEQEAQIARLEQERKKHERQLVIERKVVIYFVCLFRA